MEIAFDDAGGCAERDGEQLTGAPFGAQSLVQPRGGRSGGLSAVWRCLAGTLDVDVAGATVKFQGRTFRVARYCVCRQFALTDVGEAEWSPAPGGMDVWDGIPSAASAEKNGNDGPTLDGIGERSEVITTSPQVRSDVGGRLGSASPSPAAVPAPL